jgi:hypothetical protein
MQWTNTSPLRWAEIPKLALAFAFLVLLVGGQAWAAWPTTGGDDGHEIAVTTLADDGPGSLRWAMSTGGKRRVVFKVAGEIWLKSTILVRNPYLTVAGETAPSPGISLMGDRGIRLRTHDVILRHLRFRVGALPTGSSPDNRDAISIDGDSKGRDPAYNILVQNCSLAWSIDELLQVWGAGNHSIAIQDNIFSEALRRSLHPKGDHSMGVIIGPRTRDILVAGNLFASNSHRNPVIHGGAQALVANNLIYNPQFNAIHFYPYKRQPEPTVAAVVGNSVIAGPSTRPRVGVFGKGVNPGSRIFFSDNISGGTEAFDLKPSEKHENPELLSSLPGELPAYEAIPAVEVEAAVLKNAGARPLDRDEVDLRIIDEVRSRTGQLRDRPSDPRLWSEEAEAEARDRREKKAQKQRERRAERADKKSDNTP